MHLRRQDGRPEYRAGAAPACHRVATDADWLNQRYIIEQAESLLRDLRVKARCSDIVAPFGPRTPRRFILSYCSERIEILEISQFPWQGDPRPSRYPQVDSTIQTGRCAQLAPFSSLDPGRPR